MAKIFLTTIKKVQQVIVLAGINFIVRPVAAVQVRARAVFMAARANAGIMAGMVSARLRSFTMLAFLVRMSPANLVTFMRPAIQFMGRLVLASRWSAGIQITTFAFLRSFTIPAIQVTKLVSGTLSVIYNAGIAVSNRTLGMLGLNASTPAYNVLETTVTLVRTISATSVTGGSVPGLARNDWTNPANAAGAVNGTVATITGAALAIRNGRLSFVYPATTGKTLLTITKVELHLYYSSTGAAGNIDQLSVRAWYTPPGGSNVGTTLFTTSGPAVDKLTNPEVIDITSFIAGSWTNISDIDLFIDVQLPIATAGITFSVDAMLMKIYATRTETN